jgi:large subunit ribosomal protein L17
MRTMVTEFFENERMVTTVPKAKEVRSVAERMITLGKKESLSARRRALAFLRKKSAVFKLFDALAPRFADREGGYTRILRLGPRAGDGAELAILEFVDAEAKATPKKGAKKAAPKTKKAAPKTTAKTAAKPESKAKAAGKKPSPAGTKKAGKAAEASKEKSREE